MAADYSSWEPSRNPAQRLLEFFDMTAIALNRYYQMSFRLPTYDPQNSDNGPAWSAGTQSLQEQFDYVRKACFAWDTFGPRSAVQQLKDDVIRQFSADGPTDDSTVRLLDEIAQWFCNVGHWGVPSPRPWTYGSTHLSNGGEGRGEDKFDRERDLLMGNFRPLRDRLLTTMNRYRHNVPSEIRQRYELAFHTWTVRPEPISQDELLERIRAAHPSTLDTTPATESEKYEGQITADAEPESAPIDSATLPGAPSGPGDSPVADSTNRKNRSHVEKLLESLTARDKRSAESLAAFLTNPENSRQLEQTMSRLDNVLAAYLTNREKSGQVEIFLSAMAGEGKWADPHEVVEKYDPFQATVVLLLQASGLFVRFPPHIGRFEAIRIQFGESHQRLFPFARQNGLPFSEVKEVATACSEAMNTLCHLSFSTEPPAPDSLKSAFHNVNRSCVNLLSLLHYHKSAPTTSTATGSSDAGTPAAPKPDGPFDADGFRYRGVEVRFGRAALRYKFICALWDSEHNRPRPARPIQEVIDEVWGHDNDTSDSAFRQLCSGTRVSLQKVHFPLTIPEIVQGKVQLSPCENA
jgi:hypothetical protein